MKSNNTKPPPKGGHTKANSMTSYNASSKKTSSSSQHFSSIEHKGTTAPVTMHRIPTATVPPKLTDKLPNDDKTDEPWMQRYSIHL